MNTISFPQYSGIKCLMMPYIQGDPESVPVHIRKHYSDIIENTVLEPCDIGYLTIHESHVEKGNPQRGHRAKYARALHTEAGMLVHPKSGIKKLAWGGSYNTTLDKDTEVLIASSVPNTCAVWDELEMNTSEDGDIGHLAYRYPLDSAHILNKGEVKKLNILTPHESLPVKSSMNRQFLRIVSNGVTGKEAKFTFNPILNA